MARKNKSKEESDSSEAEESQPKKSAIVVGSGYEVQDNNDQTWKSCDKGTENQGWLYYSLPNGNTGYAQPGTWRKKKK